MTLAGRIIGAGRLMDDGDRVQELIAIAADVEKLESKRDEVLRLCSIAEVGEFRNQGVPIVTTREVRRIYQEGEKS